VRGGNGPPHNRTNRVFAAVLFTAVLTPARVLLDETSRRRFPKLRAFLPQSTTKKAPTLLLKDKALCLLLVLIRSVVVSVPSAEFFLLVFVAVQYTVCAISAQRVLMYPDRCSLRDTVRTGARACGRQTRNVTAALLRGLVVNTPLRFVFPPPCMSSYRKGAWGEALIEE